MNNLILIIIFQIIIVLLFLSEMRKSPTPKEVHVDFKTDTEICFSEDGKTLRSFLIKSPGGPVSIKEVELENESTNN